MSILLRTLAALAGLTVLFFSGMDVIDFVKYNAFAFAHPLVSDLPRDVKEASREFQKRIHEKFRPSSREADLRAYLASQGFHIKAWDPPGILNAERGSANAYIADLKRPIAWGYQSWAVIWRHDTDGVVHDLRAGYSVEMP